MCVVRSTIKGQLFLYSVLHWCVYAMNAYFKTIISWKCIDMPKFLFRCKENACYFGNVLVSYILAEFCIMEFLKNLKKLVKI